MKSSGSLWGLQNPMVFVLPLLALWSFAVAQPLYDLLQQNPTYLSAHALAGWRLILFVLVVSFLLPLGLMATSFGPAYLVRSLRKMLPWLFALAAFGLLMALFNGLLRKLFPEIGWATELIVSALASLMVLWIVKRSALAFEFLRLAAFASLIFPAIFLWQLPASYLRSEIENTEHELTITGSAPDIVLVVFDELALTTMLDDAQQLDAQRLPNFVDFAADASWYAQASAVSASTRMAVPAILSGKTPELKKRPDAVSHSRNIFSMLKGAYALNVEEPITRFCLFSQCRRTGVLRLVVLDTAVVIGHVAAPKWVVNRLPPIGGHWIGFWNPDAMGLAPAVPQDERVASINRFVRGLESTDSPGLHFLHSLLPHVPYTLLPSGERLFRHGKNPGHLLDAKGGDRFIDEPWAVTESRYQYEWQLGYVDSALGRIVAALKTADKYEDALVIVTADHGFRMVPGKNRREPDPDSFIDIASIPMLIKLPGQSAGRKDESVFQSTDIMAVIESVLTSREFSVVADSVSGQRAMFSSTQRVALPERFDFSTQRNLPAWAVIENNRPGFDLPSEPSPACTDAPTVTLAEEKVYQNTNPEHFLAAHVLFQASQPLDVSNLVASVNDKTRALHQTGEQQYSAFVDPEWLQAGYNSVQLVQRQTDGLCTLYSLP